jgi:hopanoid biosynthesis associated protein HpnK
VSVRAATRRLIVSADDFGMSPGVNEGILHAHREGILTDASLMVNAAAFDQAVGMAHTHTTLSVGLHLMLVQGRAARTAAEVPLLVDGDGMFGTAPIWAGLRYFFRPRIRGQIEAEIVAQLERFASTRLPLSHVDGHLTIHVHPTVLPLLLEHAPRYGVRAMRLPREPLAPALRFDRRHLLRKLFEATVFSILSRRARPLLAAAGVRHPDRTFGLHETGHVSEDYLLDVIARLPPGVSEIYCHAGLTDAEARRWRPADYESERELAALISPRVREAIEREGIELISYRELTTEYPKPEPRAP